MRLLVLCMALTSPVFAGSSIQPGHWNAALTTPGGAIRFGLKLDRTKASGWTASITNPLETIAIPVVKVDGHNLTLGFPHYDSTIKAELKDGKLIGSFRKRRGKAKWAEENDDRITVLLGT